MRDADSGVYTTVDSISETPEPRPPAFHCPVYEAQSGEGGRPAQVPTSDVRQSRLGLVRSYSIYSRCGQVGREGQAHRYRWAWGCGVLPLDFWSEKGGQDGSATVRLDNTALRYGLHNTWVGESASCKCRGRVCGAKLQV